MLRGLPDYGKCKGRQTGEELEKVLEKQGLARYTVFGVSGAFCENM